MIQYLSKASAKRLAGTALLRLDFNTSDEWRMRASMPTLKLLQRRARAVIVLSHRGRPSAIKLKNGVPSGADMKLSLRKDAAQLQKFVGRKVVFVPHFRFGEIKKAVAAAPRGSIFLLENIRFLHGEETPPPELAKQLAGLADYYVNDAFAVDHRSSDSVARIERFLPSYAGLELERELANLGRLMRAPARPLVLVIGGAKAHDKLGVIRFFKNKASAILVGGAAANTLLYLKGVDIDGSLYDSDKKDLAALRPLLKYKNLVLPVDYAKRGGRILDIGPKSAALFVKKIVGARTVLWSGPMGFTEQRPFDRGNLAVARAIAKNKKAFSVTGGGETVEFLKQHRLDKKFSFISTGGGAMLDFLAGEKLPGIEALKRSK